MTDKRKQLRVGLFAVVALGLIGIVLIVFGGMHFWKHHDHYFVEFDSSVGGLEKGAQVAMNGIPIGTVDDIRIAPTNLSHVRVEIEIDKGAPVHVDTHAFLSMAGITGIRAIDLEGGSFESAEIPPGGTIVAGVGTLDKLQKKAEMLADETDKLMTRANEIVDGANKIMANLQAATDPRPLLAIVETTRQVSANLAEASTGLKAMVADNRVALKQTLAAVAVAATSASNIMDNQVAGLVGNANELVGDLRSVVHNNESVLQSAMADLRQASRSFKDLAREVRERPSRLVFSAAQPERKLP